MGFEDDEDAPFLFDSGLDKDDGGCDEDEDDAFSFPFPNHTTPFASASLSLLLSLSSLSTSSTVLRSLFSWFSILIPSAPICLVSRSFAPAGFLFDTEIVCFLIRPDLVWSEEGREWMEAEGPEKVWACLRARSSSRVSESREEEDARGGCLKEGREEKVEGLEGKADLAMGLGALG